jgi:DNA-directed RNA polymerase subunit M/transcription elongation factor TFIIS
MRLSKDQYVCLNCGHTVPAPREIIEERSVAIPDARPVTVVDAVSEDLPMISRLCPKCGHQQAYRRVSTLAGEHAGVKQERTIEHFRCALCQHTWAETR